MDGIAWRLGRTGMTVTAQGSGASAQGKHLPNLTFFPIVAPLLREVLPVPSDTRLIPSS